MNVRCVNASGRNGMVCVCVCASSRNGTLDILWLLEGVSVCVCVCVCV